MKGPLVIVGDAMLDIDLEGRAGRLSPDAPVPVLDELVERARPGGAGLAAALAASDGAEVVLVTALGDDAAAARLRELLAGVTVIGLPSRGATPVKRRVRAGGQSLVRLDTGGPPGGVGRACASVLRAVNDAGSLLAADYGRGTLEAEGLRQAISSAARSVPLTWDPHPRGGEPVPGARLVTPNEGEAMAMVTRLGLDGGDTRQSLAGIRRRAEALARAWRAQAVAVTLGERGALLTYGEGVPMLVPAPHVHCVDPCGAGDRLAVSTALALGQGRVITDAVAEGVCRAAEFVAAGGAARVDAESLRSPWSLPLGDHSPGSAGRPVVVATGGCFDLLHAGHVATLRAARALGDRLVVCLNSDDSVRRLKGPGRPIVPATDRAHVLRALECVDEVVVFDDDTPVEVLRRVRPNIWTKGGDYVGAEVPELAVLEEWGGQAVVLPYVEGRSTTGLVEAAASHAGSHGSNRVAAKAGVAMGRNAGQDGSTDVRRGA
ncbi:PfkB family carbohydrate kinase [Humibacillus xanthopallidus]|uniref:RfaE bifunctional protein kinase chain/domain/rfaE bifunctional protein nucleotidyltransferase chain/domain n=1 Tax=Humibacillus xanthopallidus TaxID=412689 RepID=A0A543HHU4_9MICO|nr:PfkB family carbohydrate kinase [Humibacillus xanthopallidus]TQM57898.1 rfaE bifunctional protein kinase chain/domain/rfaE bifunctional protein nucleotidyltransferase chain/domain [Humibacillus xanthopallidus]